MTTNNPTVSIAATTASASEGSPLAYTLTRTGDPSAALTVNLSVAGTMTDGATPGSDFFAPLAVTFAAGATSASAPITTYADTLLEATEHLRLTIQPSAAYVVASGAGSATFDILDRAPNVVSIAATTASATEGSPLAYTLTRTGDTSSAMTVNLSVAATPSDGATPGSDFFAPLVVTFAAGSATATATVATFADSPAESTEHFTLTVLPHPSYVVQAGAGSTTFDILDKPLPTASIAPLAADKAEGNSSGPTAFTFTVSLSEASSTAVRVPVTITGSGSNPANPADFAQGTTTGVLIAAGQTSGVLTINVSSDPAFEPDETFTVQLGAGSGHKVSTSAGSATGTILNDDAFGFPSLQFGIGAGSNMLTEGSSGTLDLAFYRTGDVSAPLTAHYTVGPQSNGSVLPNAVVGSDFTDVTGGTITFAAGSDKAVATFSAVDDNLSEGPEAFLVKLSALAGFSVGPANGTLVSILDNEPEAGANTVSIAATPSSASEGSPLGYTLTRTGADISSALTVSLSVSPTTVDGATPGSDFVAPLQAVFAAGSSTATGTISTFTDSLTEPTEHFVLTVQTSSAYAVAAGAGTAQFNILDKPLPSVSIVASTASAAEGSPVAYTLTRTGDTTSALTVNLSVAGTATDGATPGTDFFAPLQATFAAGSATVTASITTLTDSVTEPTEHFTLTVLSSPSYAVAAGAGSATFDILDRPLPTVSITPLAATKAEGTFTGPTALTFTVSLSAASASGTFIPVTISGTGDQPTNPADLVTPASTGVFIAAGQTSAILTVNASSDPAFEADETFKVQLGSGTGYQVSSTAGSATGTVLNDDAAGLPNVQSGVSGQFYTLAEASSGAVDVAFYRTGDLTTPLTARYTVGTIPNGDGSPAAVLGTDFTDVTGGTLTFAAGSDRAVATFAAIDDALSEGQESFFVSLVDGAGYKTGLGLGSNVQITDNEPQAVGNVVSLAATTASAIEGSPLGYALTRTGDITAALTVYLSVAGTTTDGASPGTDFFAPLVATFAAGSASASAAITTYPDALVEPTEHLTLTVQSSPNYVVASGAGSATFDIRDKALPTVSLAAGTASITEGGQLSYVVSRAGDTTYALTVNLGVLGTGDHPASPGQDFLAPLQVTFAAGETSVTTTITVQDDGVAETPETFTLSVLSGPSYAVGTRDATFTIKDRATMQTWTNRDWTEAYGWDSGQVPGPNDDVTVVGSGWPITHTVTSAVQAANLTSAAAEVTIGSGGSLSLSGAATFGAATGAGGSLKFLNGGELTAAGGVTIAKTGHILSDTDHIDQPAAVIHGNVVNNGDVRIAYGAGLKIDGSYGGTAETLVYGSASFEVTGAASARMAVVGPDGKLVLGDAAASTSSLYYYRSGTLDLNDDATGFGGKLFVQSVGTGVDLVDVTSATLEGAAIHVTTRAGASFDIATTFVAGSLDTFGLVTSADGQGGTVIGFQSKVEHAPVAYDVTFSVDAGGLVGDGSATAYSLQGYDEDQDPLTFLSVRPVGSQGPATQIDPSNFTRVEGAYGTLVVEASGRLRYESAGLPDDIVGEHPVDRFEYTLGDWRGGMASALVNIALNRAPTATDDVATLTGRALTASAANGILKNDVDPDGDVLKVTSIASTEFSGSGTGLNTPIWGRYGTLTMQQDGSYTYAVRPQEGLGDVSVTLHDTFVYTVDEFDPGSTAPSGGIFGQTTATLDIVLQSNRAAILRDDIVYVTPTPYSTVFKDAAHGILANDSDPDGDTLYITGVNGQPAPTSYVYGTYGSLSVNLDGSWSYYLNSSSVPSDAVETFTINVSDLSPFDAQNGPGLSSGRSETLEIRFGSPPAQTGRVVDGYISGATVFADANGNGKLDAGEAFATTGADGSFTLAGGSGSIVSTGGTDTATGLAFAGKLTAAAGSSVITPLTTLVAALAAAGVADPTAKAVAALGLPTGTDLSTYDPIAKSAAGDAAGQAAFVAGLKLVNTATLIASTVAGANASAFDAAFTSAIAQIAAKIADPVAPITAADLGGSAVVTSLVAATAAARNVTLGSGVAAGAGQTAANLNDALDGVTGTGSAALADASAIALVAQGSASQALKTATPTTIAQVTSSYSGAALENAVQAASHQTGDVDGPGQNSAPDTTADVYGTSRGHALTVSAAKGVLANDHDPDGGAITAALATGPAHGTVALAADGSFVYTPTAGYVGSDAFTYTAGDGALSSAPTRVDIDVPASRLVLRVSETAYNGDAQFTVKVDGRQVGGIYTARADNVARQWDDVVLTGDFGPYGPSSVVVTYINDLFGGDRAHDRNLYVQNLTVDGTTYEATLANNSYKASTRPGEAVMPTNGTLAFDTHYTMKPLVVRVAESAYNGDAQFIVKVDGRQVGGTFTATATYGSAWQDIKIADDVGPVDPRQVSIEFINDAFGGARNLDRNLYVQTLKVGDVTYDAHTATSTAPFTSSQPDAILMGGNGALTFDTGRTPEKLVVRVAEDAYDGHAQFVVKVDGRQVGGVFSADKAYGTGWSDVTITEDIGRIDPHKITVDFINDLFVVTDRVHDRNLYVQSVTVGDTTYDAKAGINFATQAPLWADGAVMSTGGTLVVLADRDHMLASAPGDTPLLGTSGHDAFVFQALLPSGAQARGDSVGQVALGHDTITGFHFGEDQLVVDHLLFADAVALLAHTADDAQGNALVTFNAASTITLTGITTAQLSQHTADLLFV